MTNVLEIRGLKKSFGKLKAVDGLNMTIKRGECVAFIGQNGAGKSTTMRAIAGLTRMDEGTISIDGSDVEQSPVEARKHLGYVPQDLALCRFLTGEEYLTLIGRIREMPSDEMAAQTETLLRLCDLWEARHRMIREYSGGMARKVAMAGALIGKPSLVILDESFVGLDPESTFKLGQYLKAYAKAGGSILISSHILEMLHQMCTRFFILHHGQCVADHSLEALDALLKEGKTPDITSYYLSVTGQGDGMASLCEQEE